MKLSHLIIGALSALAISLATQNAFACTLTLKKKSATSKALYLGSQSISKKIQAALQTQCNLSVKLMTLEEQIAFEKAAFVKKIERMKSRAGK